MKRCSFIGTCQMSVLATILLQTDFAKKFTIDEIIPVHTYSREKMNKFVEEILPETDLMICQPISQDYAKGAFSTKRILEEKPNKCQIIMIPYIYFDGYFSAMGYFRDQYGNKIEKEGLIYHDMNILKHIVEKVDLEKAQKSEYLIHSHNLDYHLERIIKLLKFEQYYSRTYCIKKVEESIKKLQIRENEPHDYGKPVDIKMSDFIEQNYTKEKLFHTMNHPTNFTLIELAKRVMKHICDTEECSMEEPASPYVFPQIELEKELLGDHKFLIYPSVKNKLELDFDIEINTISGVDCDFDKFVTKYVNFYFRSVKVDTLLYLFLNN